MTFTKSCLYFKIKYQTLSLNIESPFVCSSYPPAQWCLRRSSWLTVAAPGRSELPGQTVGPAEHKSSRTHTSRWWTTGLTAAERDRRHRGGLLNHLCRGITFGQTVWLVCKFFKVNQTWPENSFYLHLYSSLINLLRFSLIHTEAEMIFWRYFLAGPVSWSLLVAMR